MQVRASALNINMTMHINIVKQIRCIVNEQLTANSRSDDNEEKSTLWSSEGVVLL